MSVREAGQRVQPYLCRQRVCTQHHLLLLYGTTSVSTVHKTYENGSPNIYTSRCYSFINAIEDIFFQCGDGRFMSLLEAMHEACEDITAESCEGLIRHSRHFLLCYLTGGNITVVVMMRSCVEFLNEKYLFSESYV